MDVFKATEKYEEWLGHYLTIVKPDLEYKHKQMRTSAFAFLRATFYRWIQLNEKADPSYSDTPKVLAIGDLHVENFGTWVDAEGRIIWGVNDFDEAHELPYTVDLIRLASSVLLAIREDDLKIDPESACEAIEDGYKSYLFGQGKPYVLAEENEWLRKEATGELRNPAHFWASMDKLDQAPKHPIRSAVDAVEHGLPSPRPEYNLRIRRSGLGALGRTRYVALADWQGGRLAREVKAMAPSAANWAEGKSGGLESLTPAIIRSAVRCPDPCLSFRGSWQVRRLAPFCNRIELSKLVDKRNELELLEAMGRETANIHLGSSEATKGVKKHLKGRRQDDKKWLYNMASEMAEKMEKEFDRYKAD